MLKTRQLHLVKENWEWNAKKPWLNYYWADNEKPQHSYPAFCEHGHATTVFAKDLDVHVTCKACAASKKDFPGIMTGLSGMVKDVQFDDDAASQLVLALKSHSEYLLFTDALLNVLDRLIKDRDEKQSATPKMNDHDRFIRDIRERVSTAVEQILEAEGYLRREMPGCAVSRLLTAGKIATKCGERLEEIVLEKMKEATK